MQRHGTPTSFLLLVQLPRRSVSGHDLLLALVRDPRIQYTVTDIVVEFGEIALLPLATVVRDDATTNAAARCP